jgi:HD-like signal output (HDOD) protein
MTALQNSYLIEIEEKYGDKALAFLNRGWEFPQQFANEFIIQHNIPDHEQKYVYEWLQEGYEEVMNGL